MHRHTAAAVDTERGHRRLVVHGVRRVTGQRGWRNGTGVRSHGLHRHRSILKVAVERHGKHPLQGRRTTRGVDAGGGAHTAGGQAKVRRRNTGHRRTERGGELDHVVMGGAISGNLRGVGHGDRAQVAQPTAVDVGFIHVHVQDAVVAQGVGHLAQGRSDRGAHTVIPQPCAG